MTRSVTVLLHALVLALVASAGMAWAQTADLKLIIDQQRMLAAELDSGVIDLTPRQKSVVRNAQQEVFALTKDRSSLADLNIAEKAKLENALERINAQVKGTRRAEETQQICKRMPVTGSAMKKTRCASKEEWDQVREASRKMLEKQHVCVPPGCGQ